MTWSSAPEAAKTDVSDVCHSTEVIGALCHEKSATGVAFLSVSTCTIDREMMRGHTA